MTKITSDKRKTALRVPGKYESPFSILPFKNGIRYAGHSFKMAKEGLKKYKSSVFKFHPALKSVACVDHVSVEFFFNASRDLLERESTSQDIVGLRFRQEFLEGSELALSSYGSNHTKLRALTDAILTAKPKRRSTAFQKVSSAVFAEKAKQKDFQIKEFVRELVGKFLFKWLLDLELTTEDMSNIELNSATIQTDSFFANLLGKALTPKCPFHAKKSNSKVSAMIEASPFFGEYRELAIQQGVSTESLSGFLKATLIFNGTGATTSAILHSIVRVASDLEIHNRLVDELAGLQPEEILQNELLSNVILECHRLGNQPLFTARRAQKDFLLPANGEKFYQIKKGDLVAAQVRNAHLDPVVFENPERFDPDRYARNPELKNKVFGYGISPTGANPFGCAAAALGIADWLMKMVLSKMITDCSFEFNETPRFESDAFLSFRPGNIRIQNFCTNEVIELENSIN